ncbi:hypothetical protein CTAYLR_005666 [Chrysophaeum taylorii]|uniref:EF-hand domain-containing protein n=1 Tax=Chrysophaeum taylorii TaxID=2483200 RepID=A0AAD7ULC5_9STRA|nr:hypothetical protein CTAYLR_005666 [Chrysophaeum taylorii]
MEAPTAGVRTRVGTETTSVCLRLEERPPTPPHVRRWRKSQFREPGKRVVHPGSQLDRIEARLFGRVKVASDHVEDVWGHRSDERGEEIYASRKREPLGRSSVRGDDDVPSNAVFGRRSANPAEDAKSLVCPPHVEETHKDLYKISHGASDPGEQRRRRYAWNVDPSSHRFGAGVGSHVALNGSSSQVAAALRLNDPPRLEATAISSRRVDVVGRPRDLGVSNKPPGRVYGKKSIRGESDWDARQCIQGAAPQTRDDDDDDLGTSLTPGYRNFPTSRPFGIPSVRSDVPKYARRSIADSQNYGDDPSAGTLIYPTALPCCDHLTKPRPKSELREILRKAIDPAAWTDGDFDAAFDRAAAANDGQVNLRDLHQALIHLRTAN